MEVFKPKPIEPKPYYHCTIHADENNVGFDISEPCCGESDCNDCQTNLP
jgi:hypothetical protein